VFFVVGVEGGACCNRKFSHIELLVYVKGKDSVQSVSRRMYAQQFYAKALTFGQPGVLT
jgi:hypothetical protein